MKKWLGHGTLAVLSLMSIGYKKADWELCMSLTPKSRLNLAENPRVERIKTLVIIAMFSDDELMERFVLKGGNAIDIVYRAGSRASVDVDLSMESDFSPEEREHLQGRIERALKGTFSPEGYEVFEVRWEERPQNISEELKHFWGGYVVSFKLIEVAKYNQFRNDLPALRRNAIQIGARGKFQVDISKFEYCEGKQAQIMDGHRIFVYTLEMVVCEKLRAICQQMSEYGSVINRKRPGAARARDFFDIFTLIDHFQMDLVTAKNRELLANIFSAKEVSLELLDRIPETREFHRADFQSVKDTVKPGVVLKDFDFYFDFVLELCEGLKAFGDE